MTINDEEVIVLIPRVKYKNNDEAAHAVLTYLKTQGESENRFTLRPFNRFNTDFTHWWFFLKGKGWPVYHCSKLFVHQFYPQTEGFNCLYAGYYVEKGLGEELIGMSGVKSTHIMKQNWYWYEFLMNLNNGVYDYSVKEIQKLSGCPVWLTITASEFNEVPETDTEIKSPHDVVQFAFSDDGNRVKIKEHGDKILKDFNECANINAIADKLVTVEGLKFFWVNLYIGTKLCYGSKDENDWTAADIWHNALEPWSSWIK